ncbi:MAG: glycine--tRNA ligase subunit beta [Candidatus Omnitrophota bacterium]|jgi:glycyl-tRNA synthetase beta chain
MKNKKPVTPDFLMEICSEELPAGYITPALDQLHSAVSAALSGDRLKFNAIRSFATPVRLVILVEGLAPGQEPQREKINGPSKEAAFDKDGRPTQACLGFLKSKGAEIKDIKIENTQRGEYIFIERAKESLPAGKVLSDSLPKIIASLKFPKAMRWEAGGVKFARPVRSILALYGDERVPFKFGSLASSDSTRLPRYESAVMEPVKIRSAGDYFLKLKKYGVILDQEARRKKILAILKDSARAEDAAAEYNQALLETVTFLSESPVGFTGKFAKEYLELPVEVLESSMAKNQKIFLLKDNKGRALPAFVAILNGKHKDTALIRGTFESILNAKLKDSIFFLREDLKVKLEERIDSLKGVVFQAKLGTMYERTIRLQKLARYIADLLGLPEEEKKKAELAALLCKTDLVTQMVKEFPDLQGIVGREYALKTGEDREVCKAIYEHYLPKGPNDPLPAGNIPGVLAIADKVDAITGFYAIGFIPTGSEDPYGTRRASLGLLKILSERKYPVSLDDLFDKAFELYGGVLSCDKASVKAQIIAFQKERLKNILLDKKYKDDIIDSVLSPRIGRFDRLNKKLEDFSSIAQAKYFLEAAKVVERASNILKGAKDFKGETAKVRPELFKEQLERDLWEIYEKSKGKIGERIDAGDYAGATKLYAEAFGGPIHLFFEKVVVNADDQVLRTNRLSLLKAIHAVYVDKAADLSKIKIE